MLHESSGAKIFDLCMTSMNDAPFERHSLVDHVPTCAIVCVKTQLQEVKACAIWIHYIHRTGIFTCWWVAVHHRPSEVIIHFHRFFRTDCTVSTYAPVLVQFSPFAHPALQNRTPGREPSFRHRGEGFFQLQRCRRRNTHVKYIEPPAVTPPQHDAVLPVVFCERSHLKIQPPSCPILFPSSYTTPPRVSCRQSYMSQKSCRVCGKRIIVYHFPNTYQ